ncbi:MAG TPA: MBL fold metallo-hydrolase [Sphingomicrobium sp.]|nr:MBL fold metallo-hydrolase [Sphingomicrobium sp.]
MLSLTFLGGAGTVTGSKYLLEADGRRILVDCGLFQGFKLLRERNWAQLPVRPRTIDAVLLTHAHLDHSGYLPLLVRNGFEGPIVATPATFDLCKLLLPDSGHLMEEDANRANRYGYSKHNPALPLYTQQDALRSLEHFRSIEFHRDVEVLPGCTATYRIAGHILGASTIEVNWAGVRIVFSGDVGRFGDAIMLDPEPVPHADYLLVESTYGDRLHDKRLPEEALEEVVNRTVRRGGTVVIPSFAVGRAQSLLYHLANLIRTGRIPDLPVFLDSPMAVDASEIFCRHSAGRRLTDTESRTACRIATYIREAEESKRLNSNRMPKIIVSASGMATGGRILHHLKNYLPDRRSTVVLAGFQAGGTRGAALRDGATEVKIHGAYVPVHAEVVSLDMFSAHADREELLRWLGGFERGPKQTFVVHGEPIESDALRHSIGERLGWNARVPEHLGTIELQ